jgi:hypothetical protein
VSLSAELTLVLLALGLYVFDSLRLMHPSEGVFLASGRNWHASFGTDQMQLSGKNLFLFSPLAPGRPAFRSTWFDETAVDAAQAAGLLRARAEGLRFLFWPVTVQLVVMFTVVPVCLFRFPGEPLVLALVFLYVNALFALGLVALWRKRLAIGWGRFALIAVECLVCIPYSINLVRKLSLAYAPADNMVEIAKALLDEAALFDAAAVLDKRIATALEVEDEGSENQLELLRLRERMRVRAA